MPEKKLPMRLEIYGETYAVQSKDDKITAMDEYYTDDGMAPQWRLDKHIGAPIK